MKKLVLITFILWNIVSYSQIKERDQNLIGFWQGTEKGTREGGIRNYWIKQRNIDGTFHLLKIQLLGGTEERAIVDKGEWWKEKGNYYELHFTSKTIDTYFYYFPDQQQVQFRRGQINGNSVDLDDEFVEKKVVDEDNHSFIEP
ncbi:MULTISPECIES: hypothetical protein [unclassified Apibacter]|uniref:hypothetical protein n=1 Tax=unclassified Apibacter TaxID=2630820 RepID=UPI00135DCCFF|nr:MULTISPECIES: hypothetical protein [unclassified Apibacter]MXP05815.1 hypothetical protein [Apibacter sp. B3546]MXP11855.1 hypothetical protein [Apibacter sp. B3239]